MHETQSMSDLSLCSLSVINSDERREWQGKRALLLKRTCRVDDLERRQADERCQRSAGRATKKEKITSKNRA